MRSNEVEDLKGVGIALVVVPNQVRRHPEVGFGSVCVFSERHVGSRNRVRGGRKPNGLGG